MIIKKINELNDQQLSETIKIFYETSSVKDFKTNDDKELFLYRYFGFYQENYPDLFFVAIHSDSEDVALGYVCGMENSFEDKLLQKLQPQMEFFEEVAKNHKAHLHINVSPLFHRQGVGAKLMDAFEHELSIRAVGGVHIITAPNAENKLFYKRRGFDFELIKKINNVNLLLMGKTVKSGS